MEQNNVVNVQVPKVFQRSNIYIIITFMLSSLFAIIPIYASIFMFARMSKISGFFSQKRYTFYKWINIVALIYYPLSFISVVFAGMVEVLPTAIEQNITTQDQLQQLVNNSFIGHFGVNILVISWQIVAVLIIYGYLLFIDGVEQRFRQYIPVKNSRSFIVTKYLFVLSILVYTLTVVGILYVESGLLTLIQISSAVTLAYLFILANKYLANIYITSKLLFTQKGEKL